MASADLTNARKLATRAQKQFNALKANVDSFLEDCGWHTEIVADKDGWVFRARIPKQPPEDWWLDLGELAGNARSALDHLVFQLAIDSGSKPSKDRTQFPIFEVENDYLRGGSRSQRERMLAGVANSHRKLIDSAQPYKLGSRAADHPLAMLRSLTDRHKHREQHVGAAFLEQFTVMQVYGTGDNEVGMGLTIGAIENPEPLLDKDALHAAYPEAEAEREVPMPPEAIERGWPAAIIQRGDLTGLRVEKPAKLTVGFFGDRSFSIGQLEGVVPYVLNLIERFEHRIAGKRPGSRPAR